MLDRLYLMFDKLSREHDIFKVETIGDAYMAVSNLVKKQDDHTKRIARFAVEVSPKLLPNLFTVGSGDAFRVYCGSI